MSLLPEFLETARVNNSAVIIADEPRVVITVARSLKRCGASVSLIHSGSVARSSRAFDRTFRVPPPEANFAEYSESVFRILETLGSSLLIPSSDSALRLVLDHEARLAKLGRLATPGSAAVTRVLDKNQTMRIAHECGLPIPTTYDVADVTALREQRSTLRFPLIVKPKSKSGRPARFKVKYLDTFAELEREFLGDPHFGEDYLIQERIEGHGVGIGIYLEGGNPVALSQHRRVKELPATGGVAVTAISEPVDPLLAEYSVRLLRAMDWSGIAMVEFKRSASGRVALMEVNGRFWGTIALAVAAGVDFPRYLWQSHTGSPDLATMPTSRPARFCWSAGELARFGELLALDGVGLPYVIGQLGAACLNLFTPSGHPVFRFSDPVPAVAEIGRIAKVILRRAVRAGLRRVIPTAVVQAIRTARELRPPAGRLYLSRFVRRSVGVFPTPPKAPPHVVLFVCHGNIMRSAYAAAYARANFELGELTVLSAGVYAKQGKPADAGARQVAAARGVSLDTHTATPLSRDLVERADLIVVMDFRNEALVLTDYPQAGSRVALLGSFTAKGERFLEIKDPYGTSLVEIDRCFDAVARHVDRLASRYGFKMKTQDQKRA